LTLGSFLKSAVRSGFLVTSTAAEEGNAPVAEAVRVAVGAEAEAGCERVALGIGILSPWGAGPQLTKSRHKAKINAM
jgi:hypothetical protein